MVDSQNSPVWPGDPSHPEHGAWLHALGQVTYTSARLTGGIVDILRVHAGEDWLALNEPSLGGLIRRLRQAGLELEGLPDLLNLADRARDVRNDVMHALPTAYGLHRRKAQDVHYLQNFYDVKSLEAAAAVLSEAERAANRVLYSKGRGVIDAYGR